MPVYVYKCPKCGGEEDVLSLTIGEESRVLCHPCMILKQKIFAGGQQVIMGAPHPHITGKKKILF
jgi:predicted nucleic acid-binding Zn ribbon protein